MKLRALDPMLYPDNDILHRGFVNDLSQVVQAIEPPYAISIDGLWGTGKTTLMQKLQSKLRGAKYPVFWFNPWEYRQVDDVVLAFLRQLSTANPGIFDEMKKRSVKTILSVLAETTMDVGLSKLTDGKISLKDIKGSFKSVEENQEFSFTKYDDIVDTLKREFIDLIDRIRESKEHDGKPVIIFFDDLDRCLPDDAIKLLEALKNLFVTRVEKPEKKKCHAIFICGIDTHIAKEFIQAHYKDIEENFAINYFRKIFNLTISMPQNSNIEEILLKHLTEMEVSHFLNQQQAEALARMVSVRGLQIHLSSVRKYLNVITNFCIFLTFNKNNNADKDAEYCFTPENDFIVNLLMLKEAWQPLYEYLIQEALRKPAAVMEELVQDITAYMREQKKLAPEQEKYLIEYVGDKSIFAKECLAKWLEDYPTLA